MNRVPYAGAHTFRFPSKMSGYIFTFILRNAIPINDQEHICNIGKHFIIFDITFFELNLRDFPPGDIQHHSDDNIYEKEKCECEKMNIKRHIPVIPCQGADGLTIVLDIIDKCCFRKKPELV